MKTNEGAIDRGVRAIAGIGAIVVAWVFLGLGAGSVPGIALGVVGLVLIVTAAVGFCPAYRLLGVSTCKLNPAK